VLDKIKTDQSARRVAVTYRPEIDGLRALAVISVIVHHFNRNILPSGYLGVDIFFVISGYVITGSLNAGGYSNGIDFFLDFYKRRVKRLVPALVAFVCLTSVLISLFNPSPVNSLRTGIAALFGASNIYLFSQTTNYFADEAELNVFTHTWSLGVEEQFYLIFPMLVWITGFRRLNPGGARCLLIAGGLLGMASLAAFVYLDRTNQTASYFLVPARLWELIAGALVFVVVSNRENYRLAFLDNVESLLLIVAIIGVLLFIPITFSVIATIAVVLLTMLLIVTLKPGSLGYKLLTYSVALFIGKISYSLYLYHWTVLSISRWTIGIHWWSVPLLVALMLLLAVGSYAYVENPLRRAQWSGFRWKSIGYALGALVGAAVFLECLADPLDGRLYAGENPQRGARTLTGKYTLPDGSAVWGGEKCILSDNRQIGTSIPVADCTLGDFVNAKHRVLVVGDSFAAAFVEAFDRLVTSDDYAVTITSTWGASQVPEVEYTSAWPALNQYYWKEVIPALISILRSGDWVFIISDMTACSNSWFTRLPQLELGLTNLSNTLSERGIRLAILNGLPFAREAMCDPTLAARQWFAPFGGPCHYFSREQTLARRARLDKVLSNLQDEGKIKIIDLMDVFCPGNSCTYEAKNGELLYRDIHSHPSDEAAQLSAPIIRSVLTEP
jgi:peptidoglycan/LPS O-acetylase OafA/YrhL